MGENVSRMKHSHDAGSSIWGILLIFSGAVFLYNSTGVLPWEIWNDILSFWPLLLVLGGLHALLGNSPLSRLILLVVSVFVFGTVFILTAGRWNPALVKGLPRAMLQFTGVVESMLKKP